MSSSQGTGASVRTEIAVSQDVVLVRQRARELAQRVGFSLTETTRIVTAASELARNTLEHGGGGVAELTLVNDGLRAGLRMVFRDQGPGIADVGQALQDGFSTGSGLGLGLGGARRLMGEMAIESAPGHGTSITVTRWR